MRASFDQQAPPVPRLAGFQLWAHNVSSADRLHVTAHCGGRSASVAADGELLQLVDVASCRGECAELERGALTNATLESFEPNVKAVLQTIDRVGHTALQVEITPDFVTQVHSFEFDVARTYLAAVVRSRAAIVAEFGDRPSDSSHDAH